MITEDLYDAVGLTLEAEELMKEVQRVRGAGNHAIPIRNDTVVDMLVHFSPRIQRDKAELQSRAFALRGRCERSLSYKREILDAEAFDQLEPYDREATRFSHMAWLSDQIERVEYALVRVKTALDMLKTIP